MEDSFSENKKTTTSSFQEPSFLKRRGIPMEGTPAPE